MVTALSEARGGLGENKTQHLDSKTCWLSIDVINVLGQAQMGLHVEGNTVSLDTFLAEGAGGAFVNCNNHHWTLLVSRSCYGPWIHTDSILEGEQSFQRRAGKRERADIEKIMADIAGTTGLTPYTAS